LAKQTKYEYKLSPKNKNTALSIKARLNSANRIQFNVNPCKNGHCKQHYLVIK